MISFDDRLRVSHQFTYWAREHGFELAPTKFLAYLEAKGYLNVEFMIEDSKKMEQLEQEE